MHVFMAVVFPKSYQHEAAKYHNHPRFGPAHVRSRIVVSDTNVTRAMADTNAHGNANGGDTRVNLVHPMRFRLSRCKRESSEPNKKQKKHKRNEKRVEIPSWKNRQNESRLRLANRTRTVSCTGTAQQTLAVPA